MALIDCTIVSEVIYKISGEINHKVFWEKLIDVMEVINSKAFDNEDDINKVLNVTFDTNDSKDIDERNTTEQKRFFNGLNQNKNCYSWWNDNFYFEKALENIFIWYVKNNYEDKFTAFKEISDVCKRYNVDITHVINVDDDPINWINKMISLARQEAIKKSLTQKFIWKNKFIVANMSESISQLEGKKVVEPHSNFPVWSSFHSDNDEFIKVFGNNLFFTDGKKQVIAYLEILGDSKDGASEFIEGENIIYKQIEKHSDIPSYITTLSYEDVKAKEESKAKEFGYFNHPKNQWLYSFKQWQDSSDATKNILEVTLGKTDYIGHKVFQLEAQNNQLLKDKFFNETINGLRGVADERLINQPWTRLGAGTWILVRDEKKDPYLIFSFRNHKKVAEIPSVIGYSSSGSMKSDDLTPAKGMLREICEEIGFEKISENEKPLKLISVGVDLDRYLIQLSYFLDLSSYTIKEINNFRKCAKTPGEQTIFFVPFDKDILMKFLKKSAFEPGAAYSLMRIIQKNFNN